MQASYLDELNPMQREAVVYCDGPSLVIAGAGSGKTRVLTYKIVHLLELGLEPWRILALTFTNKAAKEMKRRIAEKIGQERARYLVMGTFHSVFARILRREADTIGYPENFTIYDARDTQSLLKAIIKEMKLDDKDYKPAVVARQISNAKNRLITATEYEKNSMARTADKDARIPALYLIYKQYEERCRVSGAMDFDDLLLRTYLLFKEHPEVLKRYAEQFQYILVDEYQDTNHAQHCIVTQLSSTHQRICVVGDDAQSIYAFRGANIDNILKFPKLFDGTKVFKLEQNYRSTKMIVNAANSLIEKNEEQIRKEVFSENATGDPIRIISSLTGGEEGENVAEIIQRMKRTQDDAEYSDFAILYRTNAQSRIFEECFRKRNIPYHIYGGLSFYQRAEIKDVIAYFRMAVNPHDEEALKRIINVPARGIGQTTLNKLIGAAVANGVSACEMLSDEWVSSIGVNKGTLNKLVQFRALIEEIRERSQKENAFAVASYIISKSGLINEYLTSTLTEDISRKENVYELMSGIEEFCTRRAEENNEETFLSDFLAEVSLLSDSEDDNEDDTPKVTLMTIHSAKGLEFRHVFVVGMEENLFPSPQRIQSRRELEEERRLFYVAITRAEETCVLSHARSRMLYGHTEFTSPSRFLSEIHPDFVTGEKVHPTFSTSIPKRTTTFVPRETEHPKLKKVQPSLSESNAPVSSTIIDLLRTIKVGTRISHDRFGEGTIEAIQGKGNETKIQVAFDEVGVKQLFLRFAKFEVIG